VEGLENGRTRWWNELSYESLKAVKGHVKVDFIIDHGVKIDDVDTVTVMPWK
jgi:hypothetical protein